MPAGSSVSVSVPATSANLGPGFDTIGLALEWRNLFHFQLLEPGEAPRLIPGTLALPEGSLAHMAFARLLERPVFIQTEANIPFTRGLGSSSSAVVGGLVGANALLPAPRTFEELLALAIEIEGHPDNVAPALFGGIQIALREESGALTRVSVDPPPGLRAVVCVPERLVSTDDARAALPAAWSRGQTVANLGRVAVLMAALLSSRPELLRVGMGDSLHQPYRSRLIPGFDAAIAAALSAGAHGAALSGSGSAILALISQDERAIGEAMVAALAEAGEKAQWLALEIARTGAQVL